jgi:hypothetical protein
MVSIYGQGLKDAITAWCFSKEAVDKPTVLTVKMPCDLYGFLVCCSDELEWQRFAFINNNIAPTICY